jgi:hypothetical protein
MSLSSLSDSPFEDSFDDESEFIAAAKSWPAVLLGQDNFDELLKWYCWRTSRSLFEEE